jgi:hypothetical protein
MPDVNEIRITMLGTQGSGKTMYLLGLYAVMSAGLDGYSLHARNLDLDIEMTESWDALVDDGLLPEATTGTKPYELSFRQGFTKLIDIDWLDYRGGAMSEKGGHADTERLVAQLVASDSVYLTLDGSKLVGGVRPDNVLPVRRGTHANLMLGHLQRAADERGGVPSSIVVLITKSDLLIAGAASPSQALDEAVEAVKLLLPIAFHEGATTMVCPVTLGDLGNAADGHINAAKVSPRWVQKPIVFSLARYFQDERARIAEALQESERDIVASQQPLTDLRASMFGTFRKGRERELEARLEAARRQLNDQRQLVEVAQDRNRRLQDQLEGPKFFVDGVETEFVHG